MNNADLIVASRNNQPVKLREVANVEDSYESVKTASDIYSPVSGEVVEANKAVADNPALVNSDPFGAGWFFKLKLATPAEVAGLLGSADYAKQIGQ